MLDRSAGWYPPPARGVLRGRLLEYAGFVIDEEWPAQRRGEALEAAQARLTAIEGPLVAFEPATAGQQAVHAEALRAYARYLELRRQRAFGATATAAARLLQVPLPGGRVRRGRRVVGARHPDAT